MNLKLYFIKDKKAKNILKKYDEPYDSFDFIKLENKKYIVLVCDTDTNGEPIFPDIVMTNETAFNELIEVSDAELEI